MRSAGLAPSCSLTILLAPCGDIPRGAATACLLDALRAETGIGLITDARHIPRAADWFLAIGGPPPAAVRAFPKLQVVRIVDGSSAAEGWLPSDYALCPSPGVRRALLAHGAGLLPERCLLLPATLKPAVRARRLVALLRRETRPLLGVDARLAGTHGGLGRFTDGVLTALAARDYGFRLACLAEPDARLPAHPDLVRIPLPARSFLRDFLQLGRLIRASGAAAAWLFHFRANPFLRTPFWINVYDLIPHTHRALFPRSLGTRLAFAYRFLLRCLMRRARAVFAISQAAAVELCTFSPQAVVRVVSCGVTVPAGRPRPAGQGRGGYILSVNRFDRHKNAALLIEAFNLLAAANPARRLVLAGGGTGNDLDRLRALVAASPHAARIGFRLEPDEAELDALYRGAAVFCTASLAEGFGLTPLEALARGVPAVVSDLPVFREVCGAAVGYFDPRDAAACAAALERAWGTRPSAAARRLPGKFSWDLVAAHAAREILPVLQRLREDGRC